MSGKSFDLPAKKMAALCQDTSLKFISSFSQWEGLA
jgi:hypothetical protein